MSENKADPMRIPLADHDEIGRKIIGQPWAIQSAIVTIAAHCTVLVDGHPTGDVADLAGCISECCAELATALAAPQPAAPLGGREAIARIIHPVGFDEDSMERLSVVAAYRKEAFAKADAILAAIPQERGVERAGEAGTYDDDGITHASTYDEGITYAIMQLAELTGSKDWQIRDGSEDHATDVQDTIMDVLKCAGLYDDETGKLATIATTTANVVAGTDRAAIIEECALRLDESAAYEDRHIEAIKKDPGLSETGRESLIEHAITRRTAFRQGALSIRYLPRHGKEAGR